MKYYLCKFIPLRANFLGTLSADEKAWMAQHAAYMNELLDQGVIVAHGPVIGDGQGYGVSLYQIADDQDIAAYTSQDPIVQYGVGHYEHYMMPSLTARP